MCDKKNSVLFTDTECIVLYFDFKLPDENHVLLRVPRENNMYNVDLKNIDLSRNLTCLLAKVTLDESNLWHRRLGHINFKIINKLVKGNLVRGLPSKVFENNHTCVACKKGKQHKASCIHENLNAGIVGKEARSIQQYVLLPLWSSGSKDPHNTNVAAFEGKEPESEVHVSPSTSDKTKKHVEKTKREAKRTSLVELSTGVIDLNDEFEEFSVNSTNGVNATSTPITAKSSIVNPSQYPDDPNIPALEEITYSDKEEDVSVEANFSNLETNITVSSIPTTRVHKDHTVTQIIGDLSLAPQTRIARIEAIWLFLAYASFMGLMVYQMDVKSDFLYGTIEEEVYVYQPSGFKDPDYLDKVYKVVKALYGLHQAPRAWYETLANYLLENGFQRGKIDRTLFIKKQKDGKSASTPIDTEKPLLKDPDGEDVDVHTYRSMIGSLMYLTLSRPDIMFVVCACAHFQLTP
nr:putative ribonuclease H-like domain-containing protein [Tanacetum cinerariifolium]